MEDERSDGGEEGRWTGSIVADFDHHKCVITLMSYTHLRD